MVGEMTSNMYLINAPAGSGKTTAIRNRLKMINTEHPQHKVLCITYTNRAADELKKDLDNPNFTVSTIHSYINSLLSPFFAEKEVIDLYWLIFKEKIEERIANKNKDENINESNQRYIDKYGSISPDIVKKNITTISYGETPFTSLYTGKLSHDDLLMFAFKMSEKYSIILKKIYGKYNYIFIDEYQDTSAYVLKLFYNAVKNQKNISLYLLGDRMQQIYRNYDGSFEEEFKTFDTTQKLDTNHRSAGQIVAILNKIYNDVNYDQQPSKDNKDCKLDIMPQIMISSNVEESVSELQKKFPGILVLYLMNQEKYKEIGAGGLYRCYNSMETYSRTKKNTVTDVLSDISNENPDPLMKLLFIIYNIMKQYFSNNYGAIISLCKMQKQIFNASAFKLQYHADKKALKEKLEQLALLYSREESTIRELVVELQKLELIREDFIKKILENAEYSDVYNIAIKEVDNLASYLNVPTISTQHGVKGESHTSVVFVANDSFSNPNVRMYYFFDLWSSINFSLLEFEKFFYEYAAIIKEVEEHIGMRTKDLDKKTHNENKTNKETLKKYSECVLERYKDNPLFAELCKEDFEKYLANQNVGNAKNIFKITNVEGILMAYKLFYVGCSRARKNLIILVDEQKINKFKDAFIKKAKNIGFNITPMPSFDRNEPI